MASENQRVIVPLELDLNVEVGSSPSGGSETDPVTITEVTKNVLEVDANLIKNDPGKVTLSFLFNTANTTKTIGYYTRIINVKAGESDVQDDDLRVTKLTNVKIVPHIIQVVGDTAKILLVFIGEVIAPSGNHKNDIYSLDFKSNPPGEPLVDLGQPRTVVFQMIMPLTNVPNQGVNPPLNRGVQILVTIPAA